MDSLPPWALWIIAAAVGLGPGLAFFMVGAMRGSLRRTLWARSKGAYQLGPERVRDEAAIAVPPG
jgi:hypothetical protein